MTWDSDYYPFKFKLERLTMHSLAQYVYAEEPEKDSGLLLWSLEVSHDLAEPKKPKLINAHRVAKLYGEIIKVLGDVNRIRLRLPRR